MSTLEVSVSRAGLLIGERFSVSFQRTLRIPQDDRLYPLPPGLGRFPVHRVEDYWERVPPTWRERGGAFIPMYQREALWLGFGGASWKPNAVKIAVGGINAISGEAWDEALHEAPQDYVVCPDQPWLDGINAGAGFIRQFVAMPLGLGHTVEAQVSGVEEIGGIQILVYEPKPGLFPNAPPPMRTTEGPTATAPAMAPTGEMGLGAGGKIKQKVYPDPYGIDTWDPENYGRAFVYIVNSEQYRGVTGLEPPPTPVSVQTYIEHGLPWFELYDEALGDVPAPKKLGKVETVREIQTDEGGSTEEIEVSVDVPKSRINKLRRRTQTRRNRAMYEDDIKVCVDKRFTSSEELQEAAKKAIEENPVNDPFYTDAARAMPVVGSFAFALASSRDTVETMVSSMPGIAGMPDFIALVTGKRWRPGRTLRVLFLDGDPRVQSKVKEYAEQWERYANINFEFGSDSDAEIRISFEFEPGRSWSWLGTDALSRPAEEPTMNYGWLTTESEEEEYSRVVLHEFGHALAAFHEHQHPEGGISWNKEEVYRYYAQGGWSKEDVDHNIFAVYGESWTNSSTYDRFSIMHYPIPARLVTDPNDVVGWNRELSPTDKQFIGQMYPF